MIYWLQYTALLIILISYISSLRAFRLDMPLVFKQFSYFLLVVFLGEFFGVFWPKWIYKLTPFGRGNQWFYNLFHICIYTFYFYFFSKLFQFPKLKKMVMALGIVYVLFAIINLSANGIAELNRYNYMLASFMILFLGIAYYVQLLTIREIVTLKYDIGFWISTGIVIHHLGSAVGLFLINVVNYYSPNVALKMFIVVMSTAMFMYLTYTIGYLCHRKPLSGRQ